VAKKIIHTGLLAPLFIAGLLVQIVVPIARIATTYRAIEFGLSAVYVGVLSAAFALLPVFLTVAFGRFNDKGGSASTTLLGAILVLAANLGLWLAPPSMLALFIGTSVLGVGQTLLLSAMQVIATRISGRVHRDSVLGNYTVALSFGQALGPLLIGLLGTDDTSRIGDELMLASVIGSALLVGLAVYLKLNSPKQRLVGEAAAMPLRSIMATSGLLWIIIAGSLCVTAQDLLLVFLPVLGIEREIAVGTIGFMLSGRSLASMASRVFFGQLVRAFGRIRVMVWSTVVTALGLAVLGLPLPVWAMSVALIVVGLGLGLAVTCSISLTLIIAPSYARATALSLRLTANRIGQFLIPLGAGGVAASLGAAGIFVLIGGSLAASALAVPKSLRGQPS
jgi:MFS family permease